jgi:hypothetical protein
MLMEVSGENAAGDSPGPRGAARMACVEASSGVAPLIAREDGGGADERMPAIASTIIASTAEVPLETGDPGIQRCAPASTDPSRSARAGRSTTCPAGTSSGQRGEAQSLYRSGFAATSLEAAPLDDPHCVTIRRDGIRQRPEPRPRLLAARYRPDMATRRASCSCGQLTVEVGGDPVRVSICHCLACQRRTGSVFGMQARWPREQVRIEGDATEYVRISDEGEERSFFFCPRCGATVYYRPDPEHIAVPIGAFADPKFPAPRVSVWEDRMHPWVGLPDGIEHIG